VLPAKFDKALRGTTFNRTKDERETCVGNLAESRLKISAVREYGPECTDGKSVLFERRCGQGLCDNRIGRRVPGRTPGCKQTDTGDEKEEGNERRQSHVSHGSRASIDSQDCLVSLPDAIAQGVISHILGAIDERVKVLHVEFRSSSEKFGQLGWGLRGNAPQASGLQAHAGLQRGNAAGNPLSLLCHLFHQITPLNLARCVTCVGEIDLSTIGLREKYRGPTRRRRCEFD